MIPLGILATAKKRKGRITQTKASAWNVTGRAPTATQPAAWNITVRITASRPSAWNVNSLALPVLYVVINDGLGITDMDAVQGYDWGWEQSDAVALSDNLVASIVDITSITETIDSAWNISLNTKLRVYNANLSAPVAGGTVLVFKTIAWDVRTSVTNTMPSAWDVDIVSRKLRVYKASVPFTAPPASVTATQTSAWNVNTTVKLRAYKVSV